MARAAVILAAGLGTRMKSAKPKVMHPIAGLPILGHVIAAARGAGAERIVVVIAPGAVDVKAALEPTLTPASIDSVRMTHITSDVLTVLALWAMERRRRRT